uniref:DDE Tnp4 domain-containing protein n=1 Tax=Lactuca sativa TaxID=4236 RepID=A0A9R1UQR3_LACSA|nr:hypothetical protein LSAT_V11C800404300 [Lactuca sativa]
MYVMICWWMMYDFAMNPTIQETYLMSYHNGHDSIHNMVYKTDKTSVVNIRMDRNAFTRLCDKREQSGGLKNRKNMLVDEQVALFLHVLAQNEKNRIIVERFKRSCETIKFYKKLVPIPDDETGERWRWFKGCIGALDGTCIKVKVLASKRKPYRTRKGEICTNVLGECSRDLRFIYVLAEWEVSALDIRVLRDAISRQHGLKIPHESIVGTYYICYVGYKNGDGFLTPYRGQRYHLNDWSRPLTNAKELYNIRHSSTRSVIERCFGLIKSRWAILRDNA